MLVPSTANLGCWSSRLSVPDTPLSLAVGSSASFFYVIELDDGKIYRKALYLNIFDGKKPWFPVKIFP
jgi:hypothetical protein